MTGWIGPVTGRTYKGGRPRGLAPYKPPPASQALLDDIAQVLVDYRAFWPLSIRQVNYILTGRGRPKTDDNFSAVEGLIGRARRAGTVPWPAIADAGFRRNLPSWYRDLGHLYDVFDVTAERFRLDRQDGQPQRLLCWVEAAGMIPQVADAVKEWSVEVVSGGGYDSITAKHDLGRQIARSAKHWIIGVIGDLDNDGATVIDGRAEDVTAFVDDYGARLTAQGLRRGTVEWVQLAVTPRQVTELGLPSDPMKRRKDGKEKGLPLILRTTQAEAIPPPALRRIVRDFVADHVDVPVYVDVRRLERTMREQAVAEVAALR